MFESSPLGTTFLNFLLLEREILLGMRWVDE